MDSDDLDDRNDEVSSVSCNARHRLKYISSSMILLQIFTLFRIGETCNLPASVADRNLPREFDVDFSCRPTAASPHHTHDTPGAVILLRGGVLSKEGHRRAEFSRASAISFAPCARISGRCTPTAPDFNFSPPLRTSSPDPGLRHYHEGRASVRMQHGRPPKLTRSVEVND
jgi:hypothetical protein